MFHCLPTFTILFTVILIFLMAFKKKMKKNEILIFISSEHILQGKKYTATIFWFKGFHKERFFSNVWHALFVSGISRLNHINCSRRHRDHLYSPHRWKIYIYCICIVFMHSINLKNLHIYVPPLFSVIFLSHIFFSFSR